ncbi:3-galactosyl-N-acetylglucosaminide 4-alpha-L-fucosyltransferase FUT3 [Hydra vulgaris]|uniref:3-galactosyl-N-acetylglucosaminide 4-alpha-L-fucosyltransferase FUT3 n=1 Tax=Hydra vulgaris TaxID=6087 RepID=UPI001F5FC6C9|nr:3-galactosyl-N-acetylglucosaminide 4-alpha-L-fucosyltransferase FUT3-like [Hydra vulgaris]
MEFQCSLFKKAFCYLLLLLLFITFLFVYNISVGEQKFFLLPYTSYLFQNKLFNDGKKVNTSKVNNITLILVYTSFFGNIPWPFFTNLSCNFETLNFQISYDHNDFYKSDFVIFHSRNMPSISELTKLRNNRNNRQLWIYFSMESIRNNPPIEDIHIFFDLVSTYALDSDIQVPYRYHERQYKPANNKFFVEDITNRKKMIAWVVSNCHIQERNLLARKLLSYGVEIEVSGACAQYYPKMFTLSSQGKPCYADLKNFKFYFSAENGLCEDYITEKYWETALDNNIIPIVLGGSNYSNPRLAIPGSFIDAMSFNSPKDLANHILDVSTNQSKYNSYFEWKKNWKLDTNSYYCSLCQKINEGFALRQNVLINTLRSEKCSIPSAKFFSWIENS